jgi:putative membrane protein
MERVRDMQNSLTGIALAGLLIVVPAVASAQSPSQPPPRQDTAKESKAAKEPKNDKIARGDEKFMKDAAVGGMAEVKLGQLAEQKAASDAVKQFGKRMATDHAKAGDELKQLASQKGVALPMDLDRSHQGLYDKLAKLNGADFDRAYMKEMVKDHDKDVKAFRKEADSGKDPDVKSWASKTLPTLQEHQQQAKQVAAGVQGKGSPAASPAQK